jgi:hypothetical protein
MERRQYPRIHMPLPMEYQIRNPESGETVSGQGVLKNFSSDGAYFTSGDRLPLEVGQVRDFTLRLIPAVPHLPKAPPIKFKGQVIRLEPQQGDPADFGVAVKLLSRLEISQPTSK